MAARNWMFLYAEPTSHISNYVLLLWRITGAKAKTVHC
jgi:hypothetical protein